MRKSGKHHIKDQVKAKQKQKTKHRLHRSVIDSTDKTIGGVIQKSVGSKKQKTEHRLHRSAIDPTDETSIGAIVSNPCNPKKNKVEQETKRLRAQWKLLSFGKEKEIIDRYENGMQRNTIMRLYDIPEAQLYSIIRKTAGPR